MFRSMRFLGLIFILILVLGAPPVSAAGSREPEERTIGAAVSALWDALVELVPSAEPNGGPNDPDSGPIMDPNGKPPGT